MSAHLQFGSSRPNAIEPIPIESLPHGSEERSPAVAKRRPHSEAPRLAGYERSVVDERSFLCLLSLERKRTERSGKPFLLVLIKGESLFQARAGVKALEKINSALGASIRDIDLVGWYRDKAVLGIVFAEIEHLSEDVTSAILSRITTELTRSLSVKEIAHLDLSCHIFPDKNQNTPHDPNQFTRFYPDVPHKEDARKFTLSAKRVLDVIGSLFAITLFSPLMLAIAALIKLTSKGPVLFQQERVGQYGKPFRFLKFRSMHVNSDPKIHQEFVARFIAGQQPDQQNGGSASVYKLQNDPRITRLGRFLRKTSLDELPQFFNVLTGEMSLVGPRPALAYEVQQYDLWQKRRILEVKPGITGLWQVNGRSRVTFAGMVRLDLTYARKLSLWLDLKILLQTPVVILFGDGAY